MTQLTKESNVDALKNYFAGIIALSKSTDPYPVDLDDVWPLLYSTKTNALRELKKSRYRKNFDYIVKEDKAILPRPGINNPCSEDKNKKVLIHLEENRLNESLTEVSFKEKKTGGRPSVKYFLSLHCLEEMIVKRVDGVFDVYSKIFHFSFRKTEEHLLSIVPATIYDLTCETSVDDIYTFLEDMTEKEKKGDLHPIFLTEVFALYFSTLDRAIKELKKYSSDYVEGRDYIFKKDGDKTGYYLSFNGFNKLIACRSALCERAYKKAVACNLIPDMPHLVKIENSPRDIAAAKKLMKARNITGTKKEQASEIADRIMALMGQSEDSERMRMLSEALDCIVKYSKVQSTLEEPQ